MGRPSGEILILDNVPEWTFEILIDNPGMDLLVVKQRFVRDCDCTSDSFVLLDRSGCPTEAPVCQECVTSWRFV